MLCPETGKARYRHCIEPQSCNLVCNTRGSRYRHCIEPQSCNLVGTPIHALSELVDVTLFLLKMDSASTTTRAATLSFHDDSTNNRFKQMHFNTVSRSIKSLRVSLGAAPRKNWATPPHPTPTRHTLCHICCPRSAVFFCSGTNQGRAAHGSRPSQRQSR